MLLALELFWRADFQESLSKMDVSGLSRMASSLAEKVLMLLVILFLIVIILV